jgi:hypothetical protein
VDRAQVVPDARPQRARKPQIHAGVVERDQCSSASMRSTRWFVARSLTRRAGMN